MLKNASTDHIVRLAISNVSKFFSGGWGKIDTLRQLSALQETVLDERKLLRDVYSVLEKTEIEVSKGRKITSSVTSFSGKFKSPLNQFVPNALPEHDVVRFEVVLPNAWKSSKPVCINLAGTGDHYFWRRRYFAAVPLAKDHGIGTIILENPFYGKRKPKNQIGSSVRHVSDIFVMGAALMVECATLFLWCKRKGLGPLGLTGVSLGGHMASVCATGVLEPIFLVPCLSWTSAAPCFTEGVLGQAIDWKVLENQLNDVPEYMTLLRNDAEFRRKLVTHYTNPDYLMQLRERQDVSSGFLSSISSFVSNSKPLAYFDSQGKRLGSLIVEADMWKHMESFSKQIPDLTSAYERLKMEMVKNIVWKSNGNFQPSQTTLDFMVTLMDQATHISHYNKPREGSKIIYVSAENDRYMPRECYNLTPQDVWKDTEIRYIDSGHVMGILQHQQDFREAIKDGCQFLR